MNNNQKGFVPIIIILVILLLVAGGASYVLFNQKQVACTMEAKLCPDGTAVGRTGPNCEFEACPDVDINIVKTCDEKCIASGYLSGKCNKYAISPEGMANMCGGEGVRLEVETSDCKLPESPYPVVGVGIICCCQ